MTEPHGFKGTPGEWRAAEVDEHSVIEIEAPQSLSRVPLATIELGFLEEFDDEQWANATIFAASKDLLAALQECLGAMTGGMDGTWSPDADPVAMARAAIAKALPQEEGQ